MIGLIVYALIAGLIFMAVRRHLLRRSPMVAVTADTIMLRGGEAVRFCDIRQIDVARMSVGGACVVLFGNSAVTVGVDYRGFEGFAAAIIARWPSVRQEWLRVLNGPRDVAERATVWRQDEG